MAALVDTNILVYRFDPRDTRKQRIAIDVLRRGLAENEIRIAHQALVEFVVSADFQHGRLYGSVRARNPFLQPPPPFVHGVVRFRALPRQRTRPTLRVMRSTTRVLTFEEFRAASAAADPLPIAEVVRQQRAFFHDASVAEQAMRLALLAVLKWVSWDADGGAA